MKKSILTLGKALNRAEQKTINGGDFGTCSNPGPGQFHTQADCWRAGMPFCYPLNNDCWGSINHQ